MLTCQQLTELVAEYAEGAMPLLRRLQFQWHLGMCRHCRAYLAQMKATVRTLGGAPVVEMPAEVRQELLRRFRSMRPAGSPKPTPRPTGT